MEKDIHKYFDDKLDKFLSAVTQIIPSGHSDSRIFVCVFNEVTVLTKLLIYKKSIIEIHNGDIRKNSLHESDVEINILKLLKTNILDKEISPCIVKLLYTKEYTNLQTLLINKENYLKILYSDQYPTAKDYFNDSIWRYNDLVKNGLAYDKFAIVVLEYCDMSLNEFIVKYADLKNIGISIFKSLLFQIVYTIYCINRIYPDFIHRDLHTENIMLKFDNNFKYDSIHLKFLKFSIDNHDWFIPYYGITCKIIDFELSSIDKKNIINTITSDKLFNYYKSINNDLLKLFYTIYIATTNEDIVNILHSLEPTECYKHNNIEYMRSIYDKIPSYESMMYNDIWQEYCDKKLNDENIIYKYHI